MDMASAEHILTCSICFENICNPSSTTARKEPCALECGHVFHRHCIVAWFSSSGVHSSRRCPICQNRPTGLIPTMVKLYLTTNPSLIVDELRKSVEELKLEKVNLEKKLEETERRLELTQAHCRDQREQISEFLVNRATFQSRRENHVPPKAHSATVQRSPMDLSKGRGESVFPPRNPLMPTTNRSSSVSSSSAVGLHRSASCYVRQRPK